MSTTDSNTDQVRSVAYDDVCAIRGSHTLSQTEHVAREEPLEIRVAGLHVAVTMRTPGDDFDLVTGFLVTEGILSSANEIAGIAYCPDEGVEGSTNIVNANLSDASSLDPARWQRNFYATSSCGICGKASIDAVRMNAPPLASAPSISTAWLSRIGASLASRQPVFAATGGVHAAGIVPIDGEIALAREDVGRHNAVDKVIGAALRSGTALDQTILIVSGRASFEIVQKALMAQIPVVAAVSAPSSLALDLARETGMVLIGFLRENRCTVYAGSERVVSDP